MKIINKIFLIGAVAIGLVACSNDEIDANQPDNGKANTHVSVTLKLGKGLSSRAVENNDEDYNYIGKWAGADVIKDVSVYVIDGAAVTRHPFKVGPDYTQTNGADNTVVLTPNESAAIKTTAGGKTVYVVINENTEIETTLNSASPSTFAKAYEETALKLASVNSTATTSASQLAEVEGTKDYIVMTNVKPATIDVKPGITQAASIKEGNANQASLEVERTVARVLVTIAESFTSEIKDKAGVTLGKITTPTWVLAQGEQSLYVQRKTNWATPEFTWIPGDGTADFEAVAGSKYDYSGLFENLTNGFGGTTLAPGAKPDGAGGIGGASVGAGKFILATTHNYAAADAAYAGGYKKGNTAYVMVRAKFTPTVLADEGTLTDGTFWYGANGKFYSSAENVLDAAKNGVPGQTAAKYEGGKVLYYAWVNPDEVAKPYNSPVLRNNIYHIHITGFKTIGTNWNPLFPENPERELEDPSKPYHPTDNPYKEKENPDPKPTPDPKGPEEPTNPIDPEDPLTTPETWMSVKVSVLPWKVHSYEVEL